MEAFECIEDVVSTAVLKWFDEDGIAVMLIKDHDVVVSGAGWSRKFASLISVDLAQWFDDGCKASMHFVSIHGCGQKLIIDVVVIGVFG